MKQEQIDGFGIPGLVAPDRNAPNLPVPVISGSEGTPPAEPSTEMTPVDTSTELVPVGDPADTVVMQPSTDIVPFTGNEPAVQQREDDGLWRPKVRLEPDTPYNGEGTGRSLRVAEERLAYRTAFARRVAADAETRRLEAEGDELLNKARATFDALTADSADLPALRAIQEKFATGEQLALTSAGEPAIQVPPEAAVAEPGGAAFFDTQPEDAPANNAALTERTVLLKTIAPKVGSVGTQSAVNAASVTPPPAPKNKVEVTFSHAPGPGLTLADLKRAAAMRDGVNIPGGTIPIKNDRNLQPPVAQIPVHAEARTTAIGSGMQALDAQPKTAQQIVEGLRIDGGRIIIGGRLITHDLMEYVRVSSDAKQLQTKVDDLLTLPPEREHERAGLLQRIEWEVQILDGLLTEIAANPTNYAKKNRADEAAAQITPLKPGELPTLGGVPASQATEEQTTDLVARMVAGLRRF